MLKPLVALLAVVTLAGCTVSGGAPAVSTTTSTATSRATSVITLAQARQVLATYSANNRAANASLDTALQNANEAGSAAAIDDEAYLLARKQGQKSLPGGQFSFGSPQFFIPGASGYPQVFWASAAPSTGGARSVLVFERAGARAPWRVVYEPALSGKTVKLPAMAVGAGGQVSAVGPDATGLRVPPAQVVDRLGTYLSSGAKAATGIFAPGPYTTGMLSADLASQRQLAAKQLHATQSYAGDAAFPGYGLRTTSGGALVVGTLGGVERISLSAPSTGGFVYTGKAGGNPLQVLYGPGPFFSTTGHYLYEVLAYDPPASTGAPVTVLGEYGAFVSGTVTRPVTSPARPTLLSYACPRAYACPRLPRPVSAAAVARPRERTSARVS